MAQFAGNTVCLFQCLVVLVWKTTRPHLITPSAWVCGLSGAPDGPHAAFLTLVSPLSESNTKGNQDKLAVGKRVEESELLAHVERGQSVKLSFALRLTERTEARWETLLHQRCLYIQVPATLISEGSKEGFVTLLEYAEETLNCTDFVICLKNDRSDKTQIVKTFMFIGFTMLHPGHPLVPQTSDASTIYMHYSII
ncbi:ornithine decarboxylase antizyme 1 [Nilaparvata lugens]|uniref:ornithine decarboxylase antizyme 1 n=1 Tax=Nilaparvata lugens TaxID=108931 RepID=UPI00193E7F96|nr:ornithine decarboxylase antizyme 1 [Nilaparvata lugens]